MADTKKYLGDGVYADYDGNHITLTTRDGIKTTNTIVLEPEVQEELLSYIKWLDGDGSDPFNRDMTEPYEP